MSTRFEDGKISSSFICEEYLAAKVILSETPEDCRHVVYEYSDTDMLELGLDRETGLLKKTVLVLCNHFCISDASLNAPAAPDRKPFFELPRECICDFFEAVVYADGLHVRLSTKDSATFITCGCLVIGFDAKSSMTEIYFKDLAPEEVAHVIKELEMEAAPS